MPNERHFVILSVESNRLHVIVNVSREGLVVHLFVALRLAVVPQVDHVACEVTLDSLRLGKELERLPFAEKSMEEDNMLLTVLSLFNCATGLSDDVNI